MFLDKVGDHVLPDAGCPPLHVALVLPGSLQQPGKEITGPAGVDLPENPDTFNLASQHFKYFLLIKFLAIFVVVRVSKTLSLGTTKIFAKNI